MGRGLLVTTVIVLLGALGAGALFVVQNSARTTQLSLDLGFMAWQLSEPVAVPLLIAVCFGVGFVLGAGLFAVRAMRLSSRVRRLEQELALAGGERSEEWR